jgi:hypothetical protein
VFSFEFDQICPAELLEESVPWYLFCTGWRIKSAAEIIIESRILKSSVAAEGLMAGVSHHADRMQEEYHIAPSVTLSVLADPDKISSFMNIRAADIQACYQLWKSRGAEFFTEPIPKYGEIRRYIRDPDGNIIEVGQSTDLS